MNTNVIRLIFISGTISFQALAWTPKPVEDDALVRMPGTQPGQVVGLDSDKQCLSCHGGSTFEMENWKGSLMAQASRDPIFWAGLTVAAQDAIYALGTPNAADICVKCHFPMGWLDGRSDPVNASAMLGEDFNGVSCKICHYMYDPFYQATYDGTREGSDWTGYWDETGNLSGAIDDTLAADALAAAQMTYFNGNNLFSNNAPISATYTENGGGHIFLVTQNLATGKQDAKRGPFSDAPAKHEWLYSRYHKSKYMCGTCHDISNPALANLAHAELAPGDGSTVLPSESQPAYSYAHVERTFSEFMLSGFGLQGGMEGSGPYSPDRFDTSHAGNKIATCQDCHFRDLPGKKAANQGKVRPDQSSAHPMSSVPEHRMIGGNLWVPYLLASIDPVSPNYDATNEALLKQGPAALTLDFSQGDLLDPNLLLETISYSGQMLQDSISMTNAAYSLGTSEFTLRLQNHTGHKLISGYPEGRRMFLNIKAYVNDQVIYEINPYDYSIGTLKGLNEDYSQSSPELAEWEEYEDELVYEVHQSSSLLGVNETFHMALATKRYKDNRILPAGFRVAEAAERLCEPVWHGHSDTNFHSSENYYTQAEYEGGYDEVTVELPAGTERIEAALYYQTTSREFIEFLRDEINGTNGTLTGTGAGGDPAYLAQTDPFFSGLKAWGDTIWQLWDHNKDVPGAAPVLMTNTLVQLDVSDLDGDGIPAYWEIEHFGGSTNAVADLDSDLDGSDNLGEYIACTNPNDLNSVLTFTAEFSPTNGSTAVEAEFDSHLSRDYALEETTNLIHSSSWTNVSGYHRGNGEEMDLQSTNSTSSGMYRVKARIPQAP
ncbi:multiheme c-type cytochrome [Pontiellaceae bacterium B12227]|nr:multiheme c-type cytochrome [Pontiellaceae bacterium B12227]